ncbi:MAG: ATP-binding cassette domain-containing protein [Planctomycetales bacterium]|nr:ATP-binding cassette domain-containing protein [Planctomycetales bacterium]
MLTIEELEFCYPASDFTMRIAQMRIATGSRLALVGPSGVGKSTLLNLFAGILTPRRGVVRVGDVSLSTLSDQQRRAWRLRHVGYVFQDFALLDYLSVRQNIVLPYYLGSHGKLQSSWNDELDAMVHRLGIAATLDRSVEALSQGQRQRVAVARALALRPEIVLADEPSGNLDEATMRDVMATMFAYQEETKATLVVVTHDLPLRSLFQQEVDIRDVMVPGESS